MASTSLRVLERWNKLAIWITFLVEWVIIPFFGLVFLSQKGKITRAFSIFFFILSIPFTFTANYFLLDNGTALTEVTSAIYPTPVIQILFVVKLALIALAVEFLFDDMDRDYRGRKSA